MTNSRPWLTHAQGTKLGEEIEISIRGIANDWISRGGVADIEREVGLAVARAACRYGLDFLPAAADAAIARGEVALAALEGIRATLAAAMPTRPLDTEAAICDAVLAWSEERIEAMDAERIYAAAGEDDRTALADISLIFKHPSFAPIAARGGFDAVPTSKQIALAVDNLADELAEARSRIRKLEAEIAKLRTPVVAIGSDGKACAAALIRDVGPADALAMGVGRGADLSGTGDWGRVPSPAAAKIQRGIDSDADGTCRVCGATADLECDRVAHSRAIDAANRARLNARSRGKSGKVIVRGMPSDQASWAVASAFAETYIAELGLDWAAANRYLKPLGHKAVATRTGPCMGGQIVLEDGEIEISVEPIA